MMIVLVTFEQVCTGRYDLGPEEDSIGVPKNHYIAVKRLNGCNLYHYSCDD
jgi:hypothetical protein